MTLRDHPEAARSRAARRQGRVRGRPFSYPDGRRVFHGLHLRHRPASAWPGRPVRRGKSTCRPAAAILRRQDGAILVDGQDIARVTQDSLRSAIAVVPQDISLFHRSIMENIRYGRPDASDGEVRAGDRGGACCDFVEAMPEGSTPSSATAA